MDVEEWEVFVNGDLLDEVVDLEAAVLGSEGDAGHRDEHGLRVVFAQSLKEFVEVFGEVRIEALALCFVVDAVADEDVVGLGLGLDGLVVAGVQKSADVFTADTFVINIAGWEVWLRGQEDAQGVLKLRFVWGEDFGKLRLGGAIAEEDDLQALRTRGGSAKGEWFAADELIGGQGRADVFFDVLGEEFGALDVADEGPTGGIVHGVGEVTHEHDMLAVFGQLTQPEGAT